MGFTGQAYGLVDNTLSTNAGDVTAGSISLRPEFVWSLDGQSVADSRSQVSFAPRLICEQTRTTVSSNDCGGGAELGLSSQSEDGLSNAEFRVVMDRVGNSTRSGLQFQLEHKF